MPRVAQLDREAAVDRLHSAPLEDFVEERKRLARQLRSAGDREAAAEVAAWPKPSAAAWALNHLVHEGAEAVGEWLAASEALRDASGGAGGDLRAAMAEHRSATLHLVEAVRAEVKPSGRPLSAAMLERVRALLQAATADASLAEALRAGRIGQERDEREDRPGAEPAPRAPGEDRPGAAPVPMASGAKPADAQGAKRERAAAAKREAAIAREERAKAAARAELERRVEEASADVERLQAEAERCAGASDSAHERLEEAERALRRSKSEAKAARAAAKDAATSLTNAERDLERLRARR